MIVSEMSDLCLEVDCGMFGGVKEGQELETSKLDGKDQQLWYEDEEGQLRCKVEGYAVQSDGGKLRTSKFTHVLVHVHVQCTCGSNLCGYCY